MHPSRTFLLDKKKNMVNFQNNYIKLFSIMFDVWALYNSAVIGNGWITPLQSLKLFCTAVLGMKP